MPKKTKAQKMKADTRRTPLPSMTLSPDTKVSVPTQQGYIFRAQTAAEAKSKAFDVSELTAVKSDLFKTILLAAIAFAVEIGLYIRLNR